MSPSGILDTTIFKKTKPKIDLMQLKNSTESNLSLIKFSIIMRTRFNRWVVRASLAILFCCGFLFDAKTIAQCGYSYQTPPFVLNVNIPGNTAMINQASLTPILGPTVGCTLYFENPVGVLNTTSTLSCFSGPGPYTVIVRSDDNGVIDANTSAPISVTVNLVDVTPPTIICPTNKTGNTGDDGGFDCLLNWNSGGGGSIALTNVYPAAAANPGEYSENCAHTIEYNVNGGPWVVSNDAGLQSYSPGVNTVTYRITDMSGNATSCSFTVTVSDNQRPNWLPSAIPGIGSQASVGSQAYTNSPNPLPKLRRIVLNCNHPNYAADFAYLTGTWLPSSVDNCDPNPVVSRTFVNTLNLPCVTNLGITNIYRADTYSYTSTDASGNVSFLYLLTILTSDNKGPDYSTGTVPSGPAVQGLPNNYSGPNLTLNVSDYYNEALASTPCGIDFTNAAPVNAPTPSLVATATDCQAITYTSWSVSAIGSTPPAAVPAGVGNNPAQFLSVGSYLIQYNSTDPCGNISVYSFTLTIVDDVDPIIANCPANITNIPNEVGTCQATVAWNWPTATDNCSVSLIPTKCSFVDPSGNIFPVIKGGLLQDYGVFPVGTSTVTYEFTDINGNVSTCSFTVTVKDVQSPTISCSGNQILNSICAGATVPNYTGLANIFDNCPANGFTVTQTPPAGTLVSSVTTLANGSTFMVNLKVVDNAGNPNPDPAGGSNECSFTVTLLDNDKPVPSLAVLPTINPNNTTAASCGSYALQAPTAVDCNGTLIYGVATISGATYMPGPPPSYILTPNNYVINWVYNDGNGNLETQLQIVQVTADNVVPVLNCPANVSTTTDLGLCSASGLGGLAMSDLSPHIGGLAMYPGVLLDNQAIDNCDIVDFYYSVSGATTVPKTLGNSASPVSFNKGTNTVTYYGKDAAGNEGTCNFTITVTDLEAPNFICGPNVNLLTGTASDVVSADCGYTLGASNTSLDAKSATDNCAVQSIAYQVISIVPGTGTFTAGPSTSSLAGATFGLSNVPGNSATYTIRWTVTDNAAVPNTSTCTQTINVKDFVKPVITCKDEIPANVLNAIRTTSQDGITGDCFYKVNGAEFDATATDECDNSVSLTHDFGAAPSVNTLAGADLPGGLNTIIWTATDNAGNTSTCEMQIRVDDNEKPEFSYCPSNITLPNVTGDCENLVLWLRPMLLPALGPDVFDNCTDWPNLTITETISNNSVQSAINNNYPYNAFGLSDIAKSSFPVGVTTITYTAQDVAGNTAVCSFKVTINDTEAPLVANPGPQVLPSICPGTLVPNYMALVNVQDNCNNEFTVTQNPAPGVPLTHPSVVAAGLSSIFDGATFTVTITATNTNPLNLSGTTSFVVTLDDQQNPVPTIPGATLPALVGNCGSLTVLAPTADDCGVNIYGIPNTGMIVPGSNPPAYTFGVGNFNIIWTYIDGQNNTSSQSQLITINPDVTAPQINCPNDITVNVPANACTITGITAMNMSPGILNSLGAGQYADFCGVTQVTYSISGATTVLKKAGNSNNSIAGEVLNTGVNNVTYYVKDAAGNENSCTAKVTVRDLIAPVFSGIPSNVTVECNNIPNAPVIGVGGVTASDNCTSSPAITFNQTTTQGANQNNCNFYNYNITRTWTATDASNNQTIATQIIVVKDGTAPNLNGNFPMTFSGNTDNDLCTKAFTILVGQSMVTDNCAGFSNLTITNNSPYGAGNASASGNYPAGTTTFNYNVSDPCGNVSTKTVTVTVQDKQAPTPACVINVAVPIGVSGMVTLNPASFNAVSVDNCTPANQLLLSLAPNKISCSDVGKIVNVVLTVTDLAGNSATCVTFVDVQDNVAPTITCPADITVACTNSLDPTINPSVGIPVVADNCITIVTHVDNSVTPPAGLCAAFNRTWTVKDAFNNAATCVQKISVQDLTPPSFSGTLPVDVTIQCGSTIPSSATLTATDFCDPSVAVTFTETSTKTNNNSCSDFSYVITRTWTATDDCNNKSTHVQKVTLIDNTAPAFTNVPANMTLYTDNFNSLLCTVPVSLNMTGNVTDCEGVSNVTITNNSLFGSGGGNASGTYPVGNYAIKFTATDKCANSSMVTVNVTVVDNSKPVAKCDDVLNVTINSTGLATVTPQNVDEGSIDNCTSSQNLILSLNKSQFDCTSLGDNLVILTVIDQAGNANTCTSIINVVSNNSTTLTLTFSTTNETFAGAANGSATVVVSGGSGSFNYVWSDPNSTTTPTVNGLSAGFYNVTVTDLITGCKAIGTVQITVNAIPTNFNIAGTITTTLNVPVAQVQVNLTGSSTGSVTTTNNGNYSFTLPAASNVTVTPLKNINPANGLTALDLAIIEQHILSSNPILNTPYKLIAADMNNDGLINGADLGVGQAVILGNLPNFPNNTSWIFIPKSYSFPNPANPFNPAYPKSKSYSNLGANFINEGYWGVKVGDVEGSANPNTISGNKPEDRDYVNELDFVTTDQNLVKGSTIKLDFTTEKFVDVLAYQFGLDFDNEYLELLNTETGVLPGMTNDYFGLNYASEGTLTSAWYTPVGQSLSNTDKAFGLSFKVKKGGKKLSQLLKLSDSKIQTVGYNSNYKNISLGLKFKSDVVTNQTYSFELFQNQPNPFRNTTTISFTLPEAQKGNIEILDLNGKTLKLIERNFVKGLNKEDVTLDGIASGVLYYKVKTSTLSAVKKMVIIE